MNWWDRLWEEIPKYDLYDRMTARFRRWITQSEDREVAAFREKHQKMFGHKE